MVPPWVSLTGDLGGVLATQLDFIFFFYGLAFIFLGAVALAITRTSANPSWIMLACFGLIHGLGEWLDLAAMALGETQPFAAVRTAVMAGSFAFLLEFARREFAHLNHRVFPIWVYAPLLLLPLTLGLTMALPRPT
jgi:hypothetical protein